MTQVPFKITETHGGFGRSEGLLTLSHDHLVFEFQNTVAGLLKSEIKTITVPLAEVSTVEFQRKLFSTRIEIMFKSLHHTQGFPKSEGGLVRLQIARRDREKADAFVKEAKLLVMNDTLKDMLEMTDDVLD